MNKPLVSIIVTNNNGKKFLKDCLTTIYHQTHKNIEVIFVDNNSSDDSVEYVKKNFPKTNIIHNKQNIGYAGGNVSGYKKSKGEYIVILNNDVKLKPDLIATLIQAFEEIPNLGAVQPMVKLMNDPANLDCTGSFWTDTGFNYHYGIYKNAKNPKYNRSYPVYSLKGVCMMIPRKVINKVGLFDTDYWCYFEETDFCHRVWLAGYECWYYPKSYLYHYLSGTRLKKSESFIQFHSFKNRLCSYIKNLEVKNLIRIIPIYLLLNILSSGVYLFRFGNVDLFFSVYKATWWNIVNIKKTLRKRDHIEKYIRIKKDSDIFKIVKKNPRLSYYYYLITGLKSYRDE